MPISSIINSQSVFTSAFSAQAISTNAFDVFGILPGGSDKVAIHSINLGIVSSGAVSGQIGVSVFRGSTASSTSGSANVANLKGQPGAVTDPSSVTLPCATLVSTASASLLYADSFNTNWTLKPVGVDQVPQLILDPSQRLHVRLSAPSTAISLNGMLVYELLGRSGLF